MSGDSKLRLAMSSGDFLLTSKNFPCVVIFSPLIVLVAGVAEHQGEVVQYLRKIVSELRSTEGIGSRHFVVTLDSRHAIRKDLVAALEKESGKLSPDTLLI